MSKQYVFKLIDETGEYHYLVGVFDSIASAEAFMYRIKKPIGDNGSEYQELALRQIELNKAEFSLNGDPILKVEIQEVLIDVDKDIWGWEVVKWRWKEQENVPGKWDLVEEWGGTK